MVRQLLKKELYLQRSSLFFILAVVLVWCVLMALTPQATRVLMPKLLNVSMHDHMQAPVENVSMYDHVKAPRYRAFAIMGR